jgi:hypothetical protein
MRLQIFEYHCEPAGHVFRAPELPADAYGEFLLRSETGAEMAYVNALADPTYKEVDVLLQRHPGLIDVPATGRADTLRRIYGAVACDPDSEGRTFRIGQHPHCPVCSSSHMKSWQEVLPVEFVDLDILAATHLFWETLADGQKTNRVDAALS